MRGAKYTYVGGGASAVTRPERDRGAKCRSSIVATIDDKVEVFVRLGLQGTMRIGQHLVGTIPSHPLPADDAPNGRRR
jgi:hypothetical protein